MRTGVEVVVPGATPNTPIDYQERFLTAHEDFEQITNEPSELQAMVLEGV